MTKTNEYQEALTWAKASDVFVPDYAKNYKAIMIY